MPVYENNKYELLVKQQSTDQINWVNVVPLETALGELIERNSPDCGFQPAYTYMLATGTSEPVLVEAFSNGLQTRLTGKAVLDGKEMTIEQADEILGGSAVTAYYNAESTRLNGYQPVTTITPGVTATTGEIVTGTATASTATDTSFTTDFSSYYMEQRWTRYLGTGNDVWLPVYPRETRKSPYKRMDNDPACGYIEPETIYYRWIASGFTCITETVTAETQYRWSDTSEYVCSGNVKYRLQKYQASEDSGATWYDVEPYQYQRGSVLENPSSDCAMNVKTLVQIPSTSTTYTLADNHYNGIQSAWADALQPLDIGNLVRYKFARTGMHSVDYLMQSTLLQPEMFKNNQRLREVTIPANISQIGMCAFSGCSYLSAVTLENVDSIDTEAFAKCVRLTSIVLPPSLSIIGDYAFSGCSALTTVYLTCDLPPTPGEGIFDGCTNLRHIYVSDVLYTTIIFSPEWEDYYSLISVGEP